MVNKMKKDIRPYTPIEELELSIRSYNCLKRAGISTVGQLKKLTDEDFMKIRNFGMKSLIEVKGILKDIDFEEYDEWDEEWDDEWDEWEDELENEQESVSASEQLDKLIGLQAVKKQVRRITAFAKMRKDMESMGRKAAPVSFSMEFTGNPGTAKTTVARIMAGILYENGILSSREIVETGRGDLIAEYVGQTAQKVRNVFYRAEGKLLFIDEAYSLVDSHDNSFGDEAISTIVQEMENRRSSTVVVFAGYPDEMKEFFSRNPGLRSRVPFSINFDDYSAEEMLEIAELEAEKQGFSIDAEARPKLLEVFEVAAGDPEFGNGRYCRNVIECTIMDYAVRVYGSDETAEKDNILRAEDFISSAVSEPEKPREPERRRVGFTA